MLEKRCQHVAFIPHSFYRLDYASYNKYTMSTKGATREVGATLCVAVI